MDPYGGRSVQEAHDLALILSRKRRIRFRMHRHPGGRSGNSKLSPATIVRIAAAVAVLELCALAAFGQSTFGSIRGTVQDGSGTVVPGATVTAHSLDDNADR